MAVIFIWFPCSIPFQSNLYYRSRTLSFPFFRPSILFITLRLFNVIRLLWIIPPRTGKIKKFIEFENQIEKRRKNYSNNWNGYQKLNRIRTIFRENKRMEMQIECDLIWTFRFVWYIRYPLCAIHNHRNLAISWTRVHIECQKWPDSPISKCLVDSIGLNDFMFIAFWIQFACWLMAMVGY